ncbi:estradiol 17-beta-dehydrogenase 2 [Trichonephila inaurata madagascariensis]|uniref:Estradiol 17-beta-dehydrogenase 2 n=1 Tax=Trichonephila inaurata madagascariensis TaxID=2747483 RepID=A0A8X6XN17_9ARAC|nr:estradiol 17-beta-dehydrogenase 2 [Trichonephila inaurata madagascariensis]
MFHFLGCDSGFGHRLAKRLDSKGFQVFACCQFPSETGASELRKWCSERLRIIELDVTKDDSVNKAVELVKDDLRSSGRKLWAIVNNAGIHKGIIIDTTRIEDFKDCMEVNTFGLLRVTKAFLPLLKETKGRIVNVTSVAGRMPVSHIAPYIMSKYAAVAFNDCLRQEMSPWGISVVSVEPELFKTNMTNLEKATERINDSISTTPSSLSKEYGKDYFETFSKSMSSFVNYASPHPGIVVKDLEAAVSLKYPDNHYRPRRNLFFRFIILCYIMFPSRIQDFLIKIGMVYIKAPRPPTSH